jgi:hypothetical protein
MELLPIEIRNEMPGINRSMLDDETLVWARLYCPWNNWCWYVTESDGGDVVTAWFHWFQQRWGCFHLSDIDAIRGPGGRCVERDMGFTPCTETELRASLPPVPGANGTTSQPERNDDRDASTLRQIISSTIRREQAGPVELATLALGSYRSRKRILESIEGTAEIDHSLYSHFAAGGAVHWFDAKTFCFYGLRGRMGLFWQEGSQFRCKRLNWESTWWLCDLTGIRRPG